MTSKFDPFLEQYIKEYQENPRSRVFAPLAETYRKSGLIDEAIDICNEGLQYHPDFTSGTVALARCYFDKELYTEVIKELEKVVFEVPDNYLAQKLLAMSYKLTGDTSNSLRVFKMVLLLNPKDKEVVRIIEQMENKPEISDTAEDEIEEIEIPPPPSDNLPSFNTDDLANSIELGFEEKHISEIFKINTEKGEKILTELSTMTIGELLEKQGHRNKALEIYKKIHEKDPDEKLLRKKIEVLENELGIKTFSEESGVFDVVETLGSEPEPEEDQKTEPDEEPELIYESEKESKTPEKKPPENTEEVESDNGWIIPARNSNEKVKKLKLILDNIKRYKQSHSS